MLRFRPGILDFHQPRPQAMRRVWCPSCDHRFLASAKAMSLSCPVCTRPLALADVKLSHSIRGEVHTIGQVVIPPTMEIAGRLVCVELDNAGTFTGQARVGGPVRLDAGSRTFGNLACVSLDMRPGASVRVRAMIGHD